jgi:excisionase family DNA binding protein
MDEIFTVEQAAEKLKCSIRHIYDMIHEKQIRAKKCGKNWIIKAEWINEYLESA